ncbi:MAG: class I SAM-dependent methyltransferase [bacterium]|nr:class I SAM-dependent methyltransferase [bacterium]
MEQETEYLSICDELEKIIVEIGEPLEGNCFYRHLSLERWECLKNKRRNYQTAVAGKKTVGEVGFNAGHSILAMLLVNPAARYTLFDLGEHAYSRPCFEYIKARFPQTIIEVLWGDSRLTMPKYIQENPRNSFDLIHIDGGHKSEVYTKDWINSLLLIKEGGLLIFDDSDNKKIGIFLDSQISNQSVSEVGGYLKTFGYEHRIFFANPKK